MDEPPQQQSAPKKSQAVKLFEFANPIPSTPTAPDPSGPEPPPGQNQPQGTKSTERSLIDLLPGQVLFGRYRVEKKLGEGGMGTVWLVHHLALNVDRALKVIRPEIAADPLIRARFRREGQVMARLSHPGAVVVHDAWMEDDAA